MKPVSEIIKLSTEYLSKKDVASPRRNADDIVANVLGCSRMDLYLDFERPLNEEEIQACRGFLKRRAKGEPLQYIFGSVAFYDCDIGVTPDVLIPRPETEILVDKIASILVAEDLEGRVLWDICCGSGCIGIALKKRFPQLKVYASDICPRALGVAKKNADKNHADINFLEGSLLDPYFDQADYIVSNPPYIAESEYAGLELEVRGFEPKKALVAAQNGLAIYRYYAENMKDYLKLGGKIWLELGAGQGDLVLNIFKENRWQGSFFESDYAGNDRFFYAKRTF